MAFLDISFDFNLLSIDFFFCPEKHFAAILSECSLKSSRVCSGLSCIKDEIDRGPFHRWQRGPGLENIDRLPRAGRSKVIIRNKPTNPCIE